MEPANFIDLNIFYFVCFDWINSLFGGFAEGIGTMKKGMAVGFRTVALVLFFAVTLILLLLTFYVRIGPAAEESAWKTACEGLVTSYAKSSISTSLVNIGNQCAPLTLNIDKNLKKTSENDQAKKKIADLMVDCQSVYRVHGQIKKRVFEDDMINCLPCFNVYFEKDGEIDDFDNYLGLKDYQLTLMKTSGADQKTKCKDLIDYKTYPDKILGKQKYFIIYVEANEDGESVDKALLVQREKINEMCSVTKAKWPFGAPI